MKMQTAPANPAQSAAREALEQLYGYYSAKGAKPTPSCSYMDMPETA